MNQTEGQIEYVANVISETLYGKTLLDQLWPTQNDLRAVASKVIDLLSNTGGASLMTNNETVLVNFLRSLIAKWEAIPEEDREWDGRDSDGMPSSFGNADDVLSDGIIVGERSEMKENAEKATKILNSLGLPLTV